MNKTRKLNNDDLAPIVFGEILKNTNVETRMKNLRVLLDSGASGSIIHSRFVKENKIKQGKKVEWTTMSGIFKTHGKVKIEFKLPEFNPSQTFHTKLNVTDQKSSYDLILGRDILRELGINLKFDTLKITMQDNEVDMKPLHCTRNTHYEISEPSATRVEMERVKRILDAKYKKADLRAVVRESAHLSKDE